MYILVVPFRGQKRLGHAQIGLGGLIQNFRRASTPLSYAESPPRGTIVTRIPEHSAQ